MTQSPIKDDAPIFRLIYRSRSQIPAEGRGVTLGELFTEARAKNKSRQITGALMLTDGWFVQTLEGQEDAVRDVYAKIERDPRHDTFAVLEARPVDGRVFARWSMAEVSPEQGGSDTFLIAHKDGIAPAANLRPTPEQETVLNVMRTATRVASPIDEVDLRDIAVGASHSTPVALRAGSM